MASNTVKKSSARGTGAKKDSRGASVKRSAAGKASARKPSAGKTSARRPSAAAKEREDALLYREAVLWMILAVCVFLFISYFGVGGFLGSLISDLSFGIFGVAAYLFPFLVFIAAAFLISNRGSQIALIKFFSSVFFYLGVCSFVELITKGYQEGAALSQIYTESAVYKNGGGAVGGLVCSLLCPALGTAGAGVVLAVLLIICLVLITQKSIFAGLKRQSRRVYENARDSSERRQRRNLEADFPERTLPEGNRIPRPSRQRVLEEAGKAKNRRLLAGRKRKTESPRELDIPVAFPTPPVRGRHEQKVSGVTFDTKLEGPGKVSPTLQEIAPDLSGISSSLPDPVSKRLSEEQEETYVVNLEAEETKKAPKEELPKLVPEEPEFEIQGLEEPSKPEADPPKPEDEPEKENQEAALPKKKKNPKSSKEEIEEGIASVEKEMEQTAQAVKKEYVFPPLSLLKKGKGASKGGQQQEIRKTAAKLQQTLDSFHVSAKVVNASCGPSVTRYELLPEQGVKVSKITNLADDIKLNLAAADIRIEAPIPGKSVVGIEVPNRENSAVMLRDLLETEEFQKHPSNLAFATGKDIGGKVVVSDIAKMPHLLIAGATGSGKSVCINTLIMSILYKADPEDVKLILIDPKVVELSVYNGIPHLYIPVVTDPKKAAGALNWGVAEMDERYRKFAEFGVRDLKGYNKKIESIQDIEDENKPKKLPQIVIIVDELADLMMVAPGEVEDSICRLAQLARAAGIHLIIATQRPSVDVITGLIKANMPSRIAFAVSSGVDSRTIIDMNGAEKLLGKGDMLFYPQGYKKPARVQGAFVSDEEVSDVVDFVISKNTDTAYQEQMEEQMAKVQQAVSSARASEDVDELFADAGKFIIEKDKASIGMLQRVFKIGFNRAARIMDQLSEAGVVGPEEGTKPRKILMSMEQFENLLEEG